MNMTSSGLQPINRLYICREHLRCL